jgi:protein-tyrosine phosphatase
MIPLVDVHCHLLAGLDDGPDSQAAALEMCRAAYADGVRMVAATAHQNESYPHNTPQRIRAAAAALAEALNRIGLPLTVRPSAEVAVHHDLIEAWRRGDVLSVGDSLRYLLLELPAGCYLDLSGLAAQLVRLQVQPILAHAERCEAFLDSRELLAELVARGCLVQVSSGSLVQSRSPALKRVLRDWACRGLIHLVGSDGHDVHARPPRMAAAHQQLARWVGASAADRLCSSNGMLVLQGLPLPPCAAIRPARSWFAFLRR